MECIVPRHVKRMRVDREANRMLFRHPEGRPW